MSPTADEHALAWARALADDILAGREKDWLEECELQLCDATSGVVT